MAQRTNGRAEPSAFEACWLILLGMRFPLRGVQAEEGIAVPPGAGDLAGDGGQGAVDRAVILEAILPNFDDNALTLEFTCQQRAGQGNTRIALASQRVDLGAP